MGQPKVAREPCALRALRNGPPVSLNPSGPVAAIVIGSHRLLESRSSSGDNNSFFGRSAGYSNTAGEYNSFFGYGAGQDNTTGSDNAFFGMNAGRGNITGVNNSFFGRDAGFNNTGSYKQGVSYEWKTDEYPDIGLTKGTHIGLVAQDVEKELPGLVSEDKDGYKAVSYSKLTAVLVEAIKELKARNERQGLEMERQKSQIEELRSMIKELEGYGSARKQKRCKDGGPLCQCS